MPIDSNELQKLKQIKALNEKWAKKEKPAKVKFKYNKSWPNAVYPNRKRDEEMFNV
jgi:hypothetical protein